jgi:hypothetical protein
MISTTYLRHYPNPNTMDRALENAFENAIQRQESKNVIKEWRASAQLFRVFLSVTNKRLSLLDLNRNQDILIKRWVGFVVHETGVSKKSLKLRFNNFRALLRSVYTDLGVQVPTFPVWSSTHVTEEVHECINVYLDGDRNLDRIRYYQGWFVHSKKGTTFFVNFTQFEQQYGLDYTDEVLKVFSDYIATRGCGTAQGDVATFNTALACVTAACPTLEDLKAATSAQHINAFFEQLFCMKKIEVKAAGNSMRFFYMHQWPGVVRRLQIVFIHSGIWSTPPLELFCPSWKSSGTDSQTNKVTDEKGDVFNNKLLTHIPLSYTDDEAIEAILVSVGRDIEHVSLACRIVVDKTLKALKKRKALATKGNVKQVLSRKEVATKGTVEMTDPANQAATWEHHTWDYDGSNYASFLGCRDKTPQFVEQLGLLGSAITLTPFALLLIEQHPSITERWLTKLELFNENGKAKGYRKTGDAWIIESVKERRGDKLAQQVVHLNETSKKLMDDLILYTADAREWLKKQGNDDWRYLFLSSDSGLSKPSRAWRVPTVSRAGSTNSLIAQTILTPTSVVDREAAQSIKNNLGCASFRASCGVLVYLRTRSVKAMSEALGHESYDPLLLSSYLPAPILDFFQSRWVSIFQHALIFEAMKDSEDLLDAIGFSQEELHQFLQNHQLKPLPAHIMDGQIDDFLEKEQKLKDYFGVIPVTVPLLKVLSGIVELVENKPKSKDLTPLAGEWYETANFTLASIRVGEVNEDVLKAKADADADPISLDRLEGAVYA